MTPQAGLERDGADLHTIVELTMTQAALGATLSVAGPVGQVEVEIPAGVQPGEVQVLRGQGMPSLEGRRRGNFHVHTRVHIPRRLDDEQRALLEQLDETLGHEPYRHEGEDDGGFFKRLKNAFH